MRRKKKKCANSLKRTPAGADLPVRGTSPAEEARVGEETKAAEDVAPAAEIGPAVEDVDPAVDVDVDGAGLDQPEDEATEHALRLMDEALRRNDADRRWLVSGDP